jgi:hypothetical protein
MKTILYQIPVSPVEKKIGDYTETLNTEKLIIINDNAYHLANRAVTYLLGYLFLHLIKIFNSL